MTGTTEQPNFVLRCRGTGARAPQHLGEFISGENVPPLDAMTIQAYYTWRLAGQAHMQLAIVKDGADILLSALP
jgi:histidine phosphotransferase ChpT